MDLDTILEAPIAGSETNWMAGNASEPGIRREAKAFRHQGADRRYDALNGAAPV